MDNKQEFPVIKVSPSGKPQWSKGAWCLVWVYTTNGNFILKGFMKECEYYIKEKGWKCWAIFNLYHGKGREKMAYWRRPPLKPGYRTIIQTFKCEFNIYPPYNLLEKKKNKNDYRFSVHPKGDYKSLNLKRLPKQFVEFNFEPKTKIIKHASTPTLGDITLGSLKNK